MRKFARNSIRLVLVTATIGAGVCPAPGMSWSTIELEAALDNTLYQSEMDEPPVQNELSNGEGIFLFSGRTGIDAGFRLRRALVRFDLSLLPAGSEVLAAELVMYQSRAAPGSPPSLMTLHRVLQEWGEGASNAPGPEGQGAFALSGDATWFHRLYDSESWRLPDGYFLQLPSASTTVGSAVGEYVWACTHGLVADLNAWLEGPEQNFGWLLLGFEDGAKNAHRFHSREHPAADTRPRLRLVYRTPEDVLSNGFETSATCD